MHDERQSTIERARQLLLHHIRPAIYPAAQPLTVRALHVRGEPITADEARAAAFEPFAIGATWGGRWDTTWFRLCGTVPETWRGDEVAVVVDIGHALMDGFGAEALVWGPRGPEQGLSPFHNEHVIARGATGSEAVDVLVEAAANPEAPFGAPVWPDLRPDFDGPPLYRLSRADLVTVDRGVAGFRLDFDIVLQLAERLPHQDGRAGRALYALARACDLLDRQDVAGSWKAAALPLRKVLDAPAAPRGHHISALGHAHIDTAWLWPMRETIRKCARTFSSALRLMEEYPDYRFACSQPQQWAWMKEHYPALFARMKERVASGQLEPVGAMWVEADCNIPSGESLVRQVVHGKRFFQDELDVDSREVWLPDVFGYSGALPQIMTQAGVRWFLTQKISWNDTNTFPHNTFWWEGIDGSRVLAHFPPADTYNGVMNVAELRHAEQNFKDHGRSDRSLYLYGHGDGGGGPTREMIEAGHRLADLDGVPRTTFERACEFFTAAEREARDLATWSGELYFELHRGTYTTQARVKRGNRRAELALRDAELWTSARRDAATRWPGGELDRLWKMLLVHQFHDVIPGSSIGWVYDRTERDHAEILHTAGAMSTEAMTEIAGSVDTTATTTPIVVFNSLSHDHHELVEVDWPASVDAADVQVTGPDAIPRLTQRSCDGTLLFTASAPAMGYAVHDLVRGGGRPSAPAVQATPTTLANGLVRLTFDGAGLLTSLVDEDAEREVVAPGARTNLLQLFDDRPNSWDAWDIDRSAFARGVDLDGAVDVEVVEDGPLRASLRVVRSFGSSQVRQRISVAAGSKRIDFVTEVDWHEEQKLLKVAFPVALRSARATYEIQYGHVERPTHENTSWDAARFEVCGHKWADLSEPGYGVALLNDCKYGHDIRGNVMRLSLLRAPLWPDPNADRGRHRFTYSLLPHRGDLRQAGVIQAAYELNVPLRPLATTVHGGATPTASLVRIDTSQVVIEAVKRADRADGIVIRLYEAWGGRCTVRLDLAGLVASSGNVRGVARTDLLETPTADVAHDGTTASFDVGPFEIITLLVCFSAPPGGGEA